MVQMRIQGRGLNGTINTGALFTPGQQAALEIMTCSIAAMSLIGSLVACYWFCRIKKKFRHKLIIILVLADLLQSTWYFLFPLMSLVRGHIPSHSPFCQAGGFFSQLGIEMADFAILVIAIHTALQVFKPRIDTHHQRSENGLYRYRYGVYAGAATIPPVMCSLAFLRHGDAYLSQGPTCSLPLRPYWYRLAISWIPRYVILFIVGGLYLAIFIHGQDHSSRWKTLSRQGKQPKLWITVVEDKHDMCETDGAPDSLDRNRCVSLDKNDSIEQISPTKITATSSYCDRKVSDGTTLVSSSLASLDHPFWPAPSVDPATLTADHSDKITKALDQYQKEQVITRDHAEVGKPNSEGIKCSTKNSASDLIGRKIITREMQAKKNAVQHQLRLLLVYPLAYFAIWFFPFVLNICNYNDRLVQHPDFAIYVLAFASLASMGAVNSLMFTARERPWRHIKGSDGTFWGSFCLWRHYPQRRISDGTATTFTLSDTRKHSMWSTCPSAQLRRDTVAMSLNERSASSVATRPPLPRSISDHHPHSRDRLGTNESLFSAGRRHSEWALGGQGGSQSLEPPNSWRDLHSARLPRKSIYSLERRDTLDRELYMFDRRLSDALMRQEHGKQ